MKGSWKARVPAALMTVALMASVLPMAQAQSYADINVDVSVDWHHEYGNGKHSQAVKNITERIENVLNKNGNSSPNSADVSVGVNVGAHHEYGDKNVNATPIVGEADADRGTTNVGTKPAIKTDANQVVTNVTIATPDRVVEFDDITADTWCYQYVTDLARAGIISGYFGNTFDEQNILSWRAAVKLICLANNLGNPGDNLDAFMQLAKEEGWVPVDVDPVSPITRQEFCQVVARVLGLTANETVESPFSDTADPAVLLLNAAGIIDGYDNGEFLPDNSLTRGHISAIIWRMGHVNQMF